MAHHRSLMEKQILIAKGFGGRGDRAANAAECDHLADRCGEEKSRHAHDSRVDLFMLSPADTLIANSEFGFSRIAGLSGKEGRKVVELGKVQSPRTGPGRFFPTNVGRYL